MISKKLLILSYMYDICYISPFEHINIKLLKTVIPNRHYLYKVINELLSESLIVIHRNKHRTYISLTPTGAYIGKNISAIVHMKEYKLYK